jgi:cytochrome c biogenesis protein CcmG/thiol:disulfide interchange protein DsbE
MTRGWRRAALATPMLAAVAAALAWVPPASVAAQAPVCTGARPAANLQFTLKDMDGQDVALSSFKGQVIVLNFWATWCGPCRLEIPDFVQLRSTYGDQGLAILGVSVDDPVDKLKPFAAELKMNYPVLVGRGRDDLKQAYPLYGLPNTFIIARDGTLCRKHSGFALRAQLEPIIRALL